MHPLHSSLSYIELVVFLVLFVIPPIVVYSLSKGHKYHFLFLTISFILSWVGFIIAMIIVIVQDIKAIKDRLNTIDTSPDSHLT